MAFRKPKKQPEFADLIGILAQSKDTENPTYQTVQEIINRLTRFRGLVIEELNKKLDVPGILPVIGNYYDAPLTDGNVDETDFIFANGECIIVQVPNVP